MANYVLVKIEDVKLEDIWRQNDYPGGLRIYKAVICNEDGFKRDSWFYAFEDPRSEKKTNYVSIMFNSLYDATKMGLKEINSVINMKKLFLKDGGDYTFAVLDKRRIGVYDVILKYENKRYFGIV